MEIDKKNCKGATKRKHQDRAVPVKRTVEVRCTVLDDMHIVKVLLGDS